MISKLAVLVLILTLSVIRVSACINYYLVDNSGKVHLHHHYSPKSIHVNDSKFLIKNLEKSESAISKAASGEKYKYISDYCATLIQLGRYKESIPILQKLQMQYPKEYQINANLAVAYELDGQPDKALNLLRSSLKIRPQSHLGSEWFHMRILEAAIRIRDNKSDLEKQSVLQINPQKNDSISFQFMYQLAERIPLSKSPNALLSKAIDECADFYKTSLSLEWAIELYAIAVAYSYDENVKSRLWKKIYVARERLVRYKNSGIKVSTSKYLLDKNWEKILKREFVQKWENYTPYYYTGQVKTQFQ